jgi:F0F1-type ATP synthase assembly protein I
MWTASDALTMTSVTQTFGPYITTALAWTALEKNFTSPSFRSVPGGFLNNQGADESKRRQSEQERLLHRRKGLSGTEFAGIGIQFALTIVGFAFLGIWLDRRLGTSPWLVIVMVFGGAALGFWSMVRRASAKAGK